MSRNIIEGTVLQDYLLKRSIMRKRLPLTFENYKERWIVLTDYALCYYDGSMASGVQKRKGQIPLSDIKAVETVDKDALKRDFMFQVAYYDDKYQEKYQLYIVATNDDQRQKWIKNIRRTCENFGECTFDDKYHRGAYLMKEGRYSCCAVVDRQSQGCVAATQLIKSKHSPNLNGRASPRSGRNQKPLPPIPDETVVALFDYLDGQEGDLPLCKGETYTIISKDEGGWWKARDKTGRIGTIPKTYVTEKSSVGLEGYDWFYPNCDRTKAITTLEKDGVEGNFIVRDSTTDGIYTVSIFIRDVPHGSVRHYHIKKNSQGQFYLSDKHPHSTIPELIAYHQHNCAGLVVRLRSTPAAKKKPNASGFKYGKYKIDHDDITLFEVLGRGQFGEVRRGRWESRKKLVAVKTMQEGAMEERDFIDEAKTMTQLQNEYLVQLLGVSDSKKPIYIVTEYMKNGSLLSYLRRNKLVLLAKQVGRLASMCSQVAKGMQYLEGNKFIHRDLAARNCLVAEDLTIKVADFGLARFVTDDQYTSSSGSKFPIKWAPPEVLEYSKFSSKSDVWAFGVLCWEVYTCGEMPYGSKRNNEVSDLITRYNRRLDKPQHCPDQMFRVMMTCWERVPENRPSFYELVQDLRRIENEHDYA